MWPARRSAARADASTGYGGELAQGLLSGGGVVDAESDADLASLHPGGQQELDVDASIGEPPGGGAERPRLVIESGRYQVDLAVAERPSIEHRLGARLVIGDDAKGAAATAGGTHHVGDIDAPFGDRFGEGGEAPGTVLELHDERAHRHLLGLAPARPVQAASRRSSGRRDGLRVYPCQSFRPNRASGAARGRRAARLRA